MGFMTPIGGMTPAIQEALQRRQGNSGGVLNQVSSAAPTFDPSQQTPAPPTASVSPSPAVPGASGAPTTPSAVPFASGSQMPSGDPNATLIIKALSTYLNKKPGL